MKSVDLITLTRKCIDAEHSKDNSLLYLTHLIASLRHSLDGLAHCWRTEFSFRIEVLATAVAIPVAVFLGRTMIERGNLVGTLLLDLAFELMNAAIETMVDIQTVSENTQAKNTKDMASAGVALSIAVACVVWGGYTLRLLLD